MAFRKATKKEAKLRMALIGPSGSGKTYTGLLLARALAEGGKIAVIDTERGSASKYADMVEFDVLEPDSFHPQVYIDAIREAEQAGYSVLLIDSLSHAWTGKDGALELVDRAAKKTKSGSTFHAWREVTPLHNALVDAMIGCKLHLIATMRAKTEYVSEADERGKTRIRKLGLAPVQRDGLEYEFDIVADLDLDNTLIVSKSRCPGLTGAVIQKPTGEEVAAILREWLTGGPAPEAPGAEPQVSAEEEEGGFLADPAHERLVRETLIKARGPKELQDTLINYWQGAEASREQVRNELSVVLQNLKHPESITSFWGAMAALGLSSSEVYDLLELPTEYLCQDFDEALALINSRLGEIVGE